MRGFLFGALLLVLTAAACGTSEQPAGPAEKGTDSTTAQPTVATPEELPPADEDQIARGWSWWRLAERAPVVEGRRLAKQLAVFEREATPADLLPEAPADRAELYAMMPERYRPGRELAAESRLLLAGLGIDRRSLFAVPSSKGSVCTHLIDPEDEFTGPGGCIAGLEDGVSFFISGGNSRYEVYGLVANTVRRVLVVANGERHPAVVGRNGFFFEADPKKLCPTDLTGLVVEDAKGQTHEIALFEPGIGSGGANALQPDRAREYGCRE